MIHDFTSFEAATGEGHHRSVEEDAPELPPDRRIQLGEAVDDAGDLVAGHGIDVESRAFLLRKEGRVAERRPTL